MEPATKTPLLPPQAGADPRGRGPDPGFARLQGGRRALRVLPEGRALPGLHRGAAPARGRAAAAARSTAASGCWCAGTSTGAASRSWWRCLATGSTPRCASACSSSSSSSSTGATVDYHLSLGETESARIFFTVHVRPGAQIPEVPYEELEAEVERLARSWDDDLQGRADRPGRPRARARCSPRSTRRGSPSYYKASDEWGLIVDDVLALEALESEPEGFLVGIGNESNGERLTRVKLYKTGGKVDLSAFIPILEALGLRAVEEIPTAVSGRGQGVHPRFRRAGRARRRARPGRRGRHASPRRSPRSGGARRESDSLNRLVTLTELDWHQVQILRALRKYRMRVSLALHRGVPQRRHGRARRRSPRKLVHLFEARFDPERDCERGSDRRGPSGDPPGPATGHLARPGQHPAQLAGHDRGDRPHERLPARTGRR